ncbi:aminotransferase class III-fold pyridoxal phosphate-dependent enzyme [Mycobacterium sp. CVI_P3]|uniref:Aminotransferase class III-fold pyridoxal phosphate-dependent enzyme n=1 Tax=Mycobacterium pinniadriaticum TaxID=2994102 RepID=A0ABT3SFV0_9MYCO|nr:aminotransferase class III-fold pyridoxal phosphate-dependent enzyme [Mycobacterium pinniadriaticum]MCX2931967.1 aminotransferase class III-fold pyridoxal phosphate-dependent enzyme [Mycobacterium pinniadriaticum]MCX2938391.1 aminotransferase class III-fold pyridoxal phosphate-dependent enzyme [Mycobacterium pinniadriaticum]
MSKKQSTGNAGVEHADWAMFAKNGSDVTTLCLTIAMAHTKRATILVAEGAYHGALPWCNPDTTGVLPSDRAGLAYYTYNDLDSVEKLVIEHDGDLAGIIVSPFRHDAGFDQEMVDPAFAQGLRRVCDEHGATRTLDEVRTGFRMSFGGSWEQYRVRPDLSSWSKAIGNGYPVAAVLGSEPLRDSAGSFFVIGPVTLAWAAECAARGVFTHPKHNWFMSTALTAADVGTVLEATDAAFAAVARRFSSRDTTRG